MKSSAGKAKSKQRGWSPSVWQMGCAGVLLVAGLLRLLFLTEKPLHHDEGVNGLFLAPLFRQGYYHYDPANYHGPTLYYFGLITTTVNSFLYGKYGLSTFAIRLVPALFGMGIVWLLFSLRRYIGTFGSIAVALLVAVSPGFVFFSRYFIHEIPFIFFTLALVVAVMRFKETSRPTYLMLAAGSAALLFATKETYIITVTVLLLALLCAHIYMRLRSKLPAKPIKPEPGSKKMTAAPAKEIVGPATPKPIFLWLGALGLFAALYLLFYSSFLTNFPKGIYDSIRTFGYWGHTGVNEYKSPWYTYIKWLGQVQTELLVLVLGIVGIIVALYQAHSRFAVFCAFWALGMISAYSLLPYKTPWLVLSPLLPIMIMAGYFLGQCFDFEAQEQLPVTPVSIDQSSPTKTYVSSENLRVRRVCTALTLVIIAGISGYEAVELSFYNFDDDSIPYVYAHTRRDFLGLVEEIESVASHSPLGNKIGVVVASPEHWPLPWYLREYPNCGYWGHVVPTSEPVIVASQSQSEEIEAKMGAQYRRFRSYELRPGVWLTLYLRRDLQP